MADQQRDTTPEEQQPGGNREREPFTVRNIGDETAWDSGREASIGHGTHTETGARAADAETPGVKTRKPDGESSE
jgi:hypothetical protein